MVIVIVNEENTIYFFLENTVRSTHCTMNVAVVLKFWLISILLVLFIYQSSRTIMKYQEEKTSLQVN